MFLARYTLLVAVVLLPQASKAERMALTYPDTYTCFSMSPNCEINRALELMGYTQHEAAGKVTTITFAIKLSITDTQLVKLRAVANDTPETFLIRLCESLKAAVHEQGNWEYNGYIEQVIKDEATIEYRLSTSDNIEIGAIRLDTCRVP